MWFRVEHFAHGRAISVGYWANEVSDTWTYMANASDTRAAVLSIFHCDGIFVFIHSSTDDSYQVLRGQRCMAHAKPKRLLGWGNAVCTNDSLRVESMRHKWTIVYVYAAIVVCMSFALAASFSFMSPLRRTARATKLQSNYRPQTAHTFRIVAVFGSLLFDVEIHYFILSILLEKFKMHKTNNLRIKIEFESQPIVHNELVGRKVRRIQKKKLNEAGAHVSLSSTKSIWMNSTPLLVHVYSNTLYIVVHSLSHQRLKTERNRMIFILCVRNWLDSWPVERWAQCLGERHDAPFYCFVVRSRSLNSLCRISYSIHSQKRAYMPI